MGAQHSLRLPFGKPLLLFGKPRGADGGERGGGGGGRVKAAIGGVSGCFSVSYSAIGGCYGSKPVTVLPYRNRAQAAPVGRATNHGNRGTGEACDDVFLLVAVAIVVDATCLQM